MTRDLVNVAPQTAAPRAPTAPVQMRGRGFESLIRSEEDTEPTKDSERDPKGTDAQGADAGIAAALGVIGFLAQSPEAPDASSSGPAEIPGTEATDTPPGAASAAGGDATSSGKSAKPSASDARATASLAAALQAQADGFAAGGKGAAAALAEAGVVRLEGQSLSSDVALRAPAAQTQAASGAIALATAAQSKDGGTSDGAGSDASGAKPLHVALKPSESDAAADAELGAELVETSDAAAAGQKADATRPGAPVERLQALQTSAAPATPSASGGMTGASGAVAAAVQVANEIAGHAASRRTRFEVQLDPGDLGRVDVRLDIGQDGRVATRLIVERPETLDILRNDARELSRTLEQAGFQLGQGGLAFQLKDGRQAFQDAGGRPARNSAAPDEIEPAAPVAAAYARSLSAGAGGVDMTV